MTRDRVAQIALRAYPPATRASRGEEMLATLLDACGESRRRFVREIVDLARLGLRARAKQVASAGPARLVADGFCLAGIWLMTADVVTLVSWRSRAIHGPLVDWRSIALICAALAIALLGFDRLAGAGALAWTALRLPYLMDHHPGLGGLAAEALPVICFAVMVLAPRRTAADPHRLAWLAAPIALVVTFGPPADDRSPILLATVALAAIAAVAFALAMLPTDPRMALAGALGLSNLAIFVIAINGETSLVAWLSLAAAPTALVIAVVRSQRLLRAAPI
jgi:hypothetical protein